MSINKIPNYMIDFEPKFYTYFTHSTYTLHLYFCILKMPKLVITFKVNYIIFYCFTINLLLSQYA